MPGLVPGVRIATEMLGGLIFIALPDGELS